jgi:hypothetical protein
VRFAPTTEGDFSNYTFHIPSNDPDEDPVTVSVNGTGTSVGVDYTLAVNIVGPGDVTVEPDAPSYDPGTEVELTATGQSVGDSEGIFAGWSGDLDGVQNPATLIMDSNKTVTATFLDVGVNGGNMTNCNAVDPDAIDDTTNRPQNLIYGLIEIEIQADIIGGTVEVTIDLPNPAPQGYTLYKYGHKYDAAIQQCDQNETWYDYTDHVVFNANRDQVTLTLVDGGIGDDDCQADGWILDPFGLGFIPALPVVPDDDEDTPTASSPTTSGADGGGGGGGCFVATGAWDAAVIPGR